mgnify:CR=1 FL=1
MKIFFSASVSRSRKLLPVTQDLVSEIESLGHEVLTKHLVDEDYTADPNWDKNIDAIALYQQEIKRMESADALITECTVPSFGAGFFIDHCVAIQKPLLSLHYGLTLENAPLMLRGRTDINLQMYSEDNSKLILKKFFESISSNEAV